MKHIFILILFGLTLFPMVNQAAETENTSSVERLNPTIVERRHCHGLQNFHVDILNLQFDQIVFEYNSVGPDLKTPVRLTASLSMQPKVYSREERPRAIVLYNEFTTAKHGERTSQNELDDIAFYMSPLNNYILLAPDLYGWTLTEDKPQAYCCPEITARESVDAWDAAMIILAQEGYAYQDLPLFNLGYSSGGFSAMAVQKYVSENRSDINFVATAAGGAPYDITTIYENYVKTNYTGYQCAMPLMMVAYKETYGMSFTYEDVFLPPLSEHIQDWILSKDYGTWDINGLIGLDKKVNQVLTPTACDYTQGLGRDIYLKFRDNSLCGPWANWQPSKDTEYFIFHSSGDQYMHYFVGQEMANYLTDRGCNVTTEFNDWGNHIEYGIFAFTIETLLFFENTIYDESEDDVNSFLERLKKYVEEMIAAGEIPATGIASVRKNDDANLGNSHIEASDKNGYYTLSGAKLNGKPQKGIYIHQGKKKIAW